MSHWHSFPMDPPQLIHGTHKAPYVPVTHCYPAVSSVCTPGGIKSLLWQIASEHNTKLI